MILCIQDDEEAFPASKKRKRERSHPTVTAELAQPKKRKKKKKLKEDTQMKQMNGGKKATLAQSGTEEKPKVIVEACRFMSWGVHGETLCG